MFGYVVDKFLLVDEKANLVDKLMESSAYLSLFLGLRVIYLDMGAQRSEEKVAVVENRGEASEQGRSGKRLIHRHKEMCGHEEKEAEAKCGRQE